jgi:hypothetical protein
MKAQRRAWIALAVAVLAGCGEDAPVTTVIADAAARTDAADALAPDVSAADAGDPDADPPVKPPPSGLPLPPGGPQPRRFLDTNAELTGQGLSSCSHLEPATGDGHRWCSFMRGPAAQPELWVMDITRAAAGDVPPCDGTSPGCLRLTTNLWAGTRIGPGPIHPYSHEFWGDTLIFYADAVSALPDLHRGPVYAWRPGWPAARRISGPRAIVCWGHYQLPLVHCWEDLVGDLDQADSIELTAGLLADGTGDVVLPSLGKIPLHPSRGVLGWQSAYAPKGDVYAVSSPDPQTAIESLRIVATGDLGKAAPQEILRDVRQWEISPAGTKVYFYRAEPLGGRALWVADFPSGAHETKIAAGVEAFLPIGDAAGDQGITFIIGLTEEVGTLRLLRDPLRPSSATTIFAYTDMLEGVLFSPDFRFTAWSDGHFDMRVVDNGDLGSCFLNTSPKRDAFAPSFTDSAGLVFWIEDSADVPGRLDGFLATPRGCATKQRIGLSVDYTIPVGDRGAFIADEADPDLFTITLKYAALTEGKAWPAAGPVRVHADVDNSFVVPLGVRPLYVIFKVREGGPAEKGTYVFGPVPF